MNSENEAPETEAPKAKSRRGFASMPKEKQKEIASKGGKAAQALGVAHAFTSEEARVAGRKGGQKHSKEHLREIGRKGGLAAGKKKKKEEAA